MSWLVELARADPRLDSGRRGPRRNNIMSADGRAHKRASRAGGPHAKEGAKPSNGGILLWFSVSTQDR